MINVLEVAHFTARYSIIPKAELDHTIIENWGIKRGKDRAIPVVARKIFVDDQQPHFCASLYLKEDVKKCFMDRYCRRLTINNHVQ